MKFIRISHKFEKEEKIAQISHYLCLGLCLCKLSIRFAMDLPNRVFFYENVKISFWISCKWHWFKEPIRSNVQCDDLIFVDFLDFDTYLNWTINGNNMQSVLFHWRFKSVIGFGMELRLVSLVPLCKNIKNVSWTWHLSTYLKFPYGKKSIAIELYYDTQ